MPGVRCGVRYVPLQRVGLYVPGGSAPLFSTVLMLGVPAAIAEVPEVYLCTPPARDGSIHPAILYAAALCGIRHIWRCGGAQAIAAMALGTESLPP
jgi:histidinol dehydrogenase